jgi:zinc D-Ala-D-Ala dipeptidase/carboxypeptidase
MNNKRITMSDTEKGSLILVNRDHPLKGETSGKLINVGGMGVLLESRTAAMLGQLLKDIKGEEDITAVSGYRSYKEQKEIFNDSLAENGREFTERYVAYPGCSEHQTGYAIDLGKTAEEIDFLCPDFPYAGTPQKFRDKAADYGFIQRYEKEKERVTKIGHEPWHFRYVGYPHSRIMKDNNLSLEEYMEFIEEHRYGVNPFVFHGNKQSFEIGCLKLEEKEQEVTISEDIIYQISGSNRKSVIITLWKEQKV